MTPARLVTACGTVYSGKIIAGERKLRDKKKPSMVLMFEITDTARRPQ